MIVNKRKRIQKIVIASALLVAGLFLFLNYSKYIFKAEELNNGEAQVANLTNNGTQIPKYDKFELTFDLNWYKNRDFTNQNAKYDALADEWTKDIAYKANINVKYNNKIYIATQDITKENNTTSPDTATTLWTDSGRSYINPYWPYDPNPIADQTSPWNSSVSYNTSQRVTYNGTTYKAIHNSPVSFTSKADVSKTTDTYWAATSGLGPVVYLDNDPRKEVYECIISSGANGDGGPDSDSHGVNSPDPWWRDLGYTAADTAPNGSHASEYWLTNPADPVPEKGVGVSVDGQFLYLTDGSQTPNWSSATKASSSANIQSGQYLNQPGFYYKNYQQFKPNNVGDWGDHIVPVSDQWKVRFAPTKEGAWYYRLKVVDVTGQTIYYPATSLISTSSQNHGFAQVAKNDSRYFETSDGKYLPLVGTENLNVYDNQSGKLLSNATINSANSYYANLKDKMNIQRTWWSGANGWLAVFGMSNNNGHNDVYWSNHSDTITPLKDYIDPNMPPSWNKDLFVFKPAFDTNTTYFNQKLPIKPSVKYQISVWFKTANITLDPNCSGNKCGKLYIDPGANDVQASATYAGTSLDLTQNNGTYNWTQVKGTFTATAGTDSLPWLTVGHDGVTGGTLLFNDISVKEVNGDGTLGPELMPISNPNLYNYYNQYTSAVADAQVEAARVNGVYLDIALNAKEDGLWNSINDDGSAVPMRFNGNPFGKSYGANRTYLNYFWRYTAARWGYSTSIHSFELCNESYVSTGAMEQTNDMAVQFKQNDPNQHMVTVNFDHHDMINGQGIAWSEINKPNGLYPDVAYANFHEAMGTMSGVSNTPGWDIQNDPSSPWTVDSGCGRNNSKCLHTNKATAGNTSLRMSTFTGIPDHIYTLRWWNKQSGANLSSTISVLANASYTRDMRWPVTIKTIPLVYDIRNAITSNQLTTSTDGPLSGNDIASSTPPDSWQQRGLQFIVPNFPTYAATYPNINREFAGNTPSLPDMPYEDLSINLSNFSGNMYFDDFTLYDETAQKPVILLNGNFEESVMEEDTAMTSYYEGYMRGEPAQRVVHAPVVNSNLNFYDQNVGENAEINNNLDPTYSWYKKFLWGQVNHYGLIAFWYDFSGIKNQASIVNTALPLGQAYLNFMKDIPLNNGKYQDSAAQTSSFDLRAWGQKEITNGKSDRAHLWIDNKPYSWKSLINNNVPSPISGTITIPDMQSSKNFNLEWWNTAESDPTKQITGTTQAASDSQGNLTFQVANLASDTAVKISVVEIPSTPTPSPLITPTPTTTAPLTPTPTASTSTPTSPTPSAVSSSTPVPSATTVTSSGTSSVIKSVKGTASKVIKKIVNKTKLATKKVVDKTKLAVKKTKVKVKQVIDKLKLIFQKKNQNQNLK